MNTHLMIRMILAAGLTQLAVAGTHFVVPPETPDVTPTHPYDSWETAGTDLNVVVAAALDGSAPRTVNVADGIYYLTNQVNVTQALTLQSVNGRDVTVVDGNNTVAKAVTNRCFYLAANDILLEGFTIRNGYFFGEDGGGGVYCAYDFNISVIDCRIINCVATNGNDKYACGGGVCVGNQTVLSRCEVIGNNNYGAYGGGVYAGGYVVGCTIASNTVHYAYNSEGGGTAEANGGGVMLSSGVISNCTIFGNSAVRAIGSTSGRYGGGVRISSGGKMFNSLIHRNTAYRGSGIYVRDLTFIQNCTVADNTSYGLYIPSQANITNWLVNVICPSSSAGDLTLNATGFNIVDSCCVPSTNFTVAGLFVNNTQSDPQFENSGDANYRLAKGSPCIDAGTNAVWMADAVDLDGNRRIDAYSLIVDMGCYEYSPMRGTQILVR